MSAGVYLQSNQVKLKYKKTILFAYVFLSIFAIFCQVVFLGYLMKENLSEFFEFYYFGKEELPESVQQIMCEYNGLTSIIVSIIISSFSVKENYQKIQLVSSDKTKIPAKILLITQISLSNWIALWSIFLMMKRQSPTS